jgi:protein SFI1
MGIVLEIENQTASIGSSRGQDGGTLPIPIPDDPNLHARRVAHPSRNAPNRKNRHLPERLKPQPPKNWTGAPDDIIDSRGTSDSGQYEPLVIGSYGEGHGAFFGGPSATASDGGDTEQSRRTPQSGPGSEFHRGGSDTTVQTGDEDGQHYVVTKYTERGQPYSTIEGLRGWRILTPYAPSCEVRRPFRSDEPAESRSLDKQNHHDVEHPREQPETPDPEPPLRIKVQEQLERRASRASELYKSAKALSHMFACFEERSERISVARRHIIRFRYFGSWSEVMSASKSTARKFRIGPCFGSWSTQFARQKVLECQAKRNYNGTLQKFAFSCWRRLYHERVATNWRRQCLSSGGYHSWVASASHSPNLAGALAYRDQYLLRCAFVAWTAKFRQLASPSPGGGRRERPHAILQQPLTSGRDDIAVDRRVILYRQKQQRQRMRNTLHHILSQFNNQQSLEARVVGTSSRAATTKALSELGTIWAELLTRQRRSDRLSQFYEHRQVVEANEAGLQLWQQNLRNVQDYEVWAARARNYYCGMDTLKRWREITITESKRRALLCYKVARHHVKMLVGKHALAKWRTETDQSVDLTHRGEQYRDGNLRAEGVCRWRLHVREEVKAERLALWQALRGPLGSWQEQAGSLVEVELYCEEEGEAQAKRSALHKWSVKTLQVKASQHIAAEMVAKVERTFLRKGWRTWMVQHAMRTGVRLPAEMFGRSSVGSRTGVDPPNALRGSLMSRMSARRPLRFSTQPSNRRMFDSDERAEEDDQLGALPPTDSELMSTPTRWTGFRVSVTDRSSTTPSAPLSTPFERELRRQFGGSQQPRISSLLGRPSPLDTPQSISTTRQSRRDGADTQLPQRRR